MKKKLKLYSRDWKRNSMQLYILKENKPYKEVKLEGINGVYKYKSERIESGSYSFYVVTEGKNFSVVYSHTCLLYTSPSPRD